MVKNSPQFNMMIAGTGGQGLITLLQIIAEAALFEGNEIRTSELHGLSQRGGSVEVHLRFGKNIYSPLIARKGADLILALEMQETIRAVEFSDADTFFLINRHIIPIPGVKELSEQEIVNDLNKISKKVEVIGATEICKKGLGTDVVAGIYLVSLASFRGLIPLKTNSILKAIKKMIPEKYLELNIKTFELARDRV